MWLGPRELGATLGGSMAGVRDEWARAEKRG